MRAVRDEADREYLLLKRSAESSRVRNPETGEERYLPNESLEPVGEDPLAVAARAVDGGVRRVLRACSTDAMLGLLLVLHRRGPLSVRVLLDAAEACESDLHGMLAELTVAECIEECEIAGERGYRVTEEVAAALDALTGTR
jgi:hypothetical protein